MADKKISALTGATTPLAGTEVLPVVQSGSTVKVAVSDLTAGRAISATQLTLTTGNLIVSNGKGIDFSATPGTGTSELLADYEEGTWSPDYNGSTVGTTTYSQQIGKYTKIGNIVYYQIDLIFSATTGSGAARIYGFPFTSGSTYHTASMLPNNIALTALNVIIMRFGYGTYMDILQTPVGGGAYTQVAVDASGELVVTGFYFI